MSDCRSMSILFITDLSRWKVYKNYVVFTNLINYFVA